MKLIICEKPSQAMSVSEAIPETVYRKDGWFESASYIITSAFGHVYGLSDIEKYRDDYDPNHRYNWNETELPWYPKDNKWLWEADSKAQERIELINKFMNDPSIDEIIGATDIDAEGELIYRNIIRNGLKVKKKITRIFPKDQTPEVIWEAILNRQDYRNYDSLYLEALMRTYADFLIGINLTRGLTLKAGTLLRVGRVNTAIVDSIYNRDQEIANFKSKPFYVVESNVNGIKLSLPNRFDTPADAQDFADQLNRQKAIVSSIETKEIEKIRPKLFSQATLQAEMGTLYGLAPERTLASCQRLYEAKLLSYPRTNSEYLTKGEKETVNKVLAAHNINSTADINKKAFDDKKVEAHSAIIPTTSSNFKGSDQDKQVYQTVFNRFKAAFYPVACVYNQTKATIQIGNEEITLTGNILKQEGWLKLMPGKHEDKLLPPLNQGQEVKVKFEVIPKKTTPPSNYTIKSLTGYCLAPFKKSDSEDDEYAEILEGATIGQESSRATIIANAVSNGLIILKKDKYLITDKGKALIETLHDADIGLDAELTVKIQKLIKKVSRKEMSIDEGLEKVKDYINQAFTKLESRGKRKMSEINKATAETAVCPWCQGTLYKRKGKYGFFYAHEKEMQEECGFIVGQTIKYYGQDIKLTEKQLDTLMKKGAVKVKNVKDKFGTYNGTLNLLPEPSEWNGKMYPKYNITEKQYQKDQD